MSSRLRSLDSKISFFAFADIITAVSGVLIFVALLLATDLGKPTDSRSQAENSEAERHYQAAIAQQAAVEAENQRLAELLAAAANAPDVEKLQADIVGLRTQLAAAQQKQADFTNQMAGREAAIEARDRTLGLTGLKEEIRGVNQETAGISRQDDAARGEAATWQEKIVRAGNKLVNLRQRAGQLWLIPERNLSSKEPILVTVGRNGLIIEHFDRPDQRRQLDGKSGVLQAFKTYLAGADNNHQYVVFMVRPSGIGLFRDAAKTAKDAGFDVGSDALEEDREFHFSTPPPMDDSAPPPETPSGTPPPPPTGSTATNGSPSAGGVPSGAAATTKHPPATATNTSASKPSPTATAGAPPPKKEKNWWQRLLEWIGLE